MEDWRHHSPHLRLQHRRDGQDVNEGFGRHLNVGEGKLQFRSSLFSWKRGQQDSRDRSYQESCDETQEDMVKALSKPVMEED